MNKLVAEGIDKNLDGLDILQNISIKVPSDTIATMIGPSGCGKSTFFHIISGILCPDKGKISIDGKDYTGKTGRIGYLQQKDCLFPWKSVLKNVILPLELKRMDSNEAHSMGKKYLTKFGLGGFDHYYPFELSGGMRQRAALLRTYLFQSDILLLDEPFAQLDAITRKNMQEWLLKIKNEFHLTILMITHDIEEAVFLSDQIIVFSALPGRILAQYHPSLPKDRTLKYLASHDFTYWKEKIMNDLLL